MRRAIVLSALLVASCSRSNKPEDQIVGAWTGDPPGLAQMKKDPAMKEFASMLSDSVGLVLKVDHTYALDYFATKTGTWQMTARTIKFEETASRASMPKLFDETFDFGTVWKTGKRTYSAVLSADDRKITLMMGKLGQVDFHR
jgi:hypothetical protein